MPTSPATAAGAAPATPPVPLTPVVLHPLTYLDDNGEVVIGRTDIDSYGVFPPDGAALLRRLADGAAPAEAARWYAETYGEPVDMAEFLDVLADLDFLAAAADEPPQAPPRWQRLGRWLYSPPAWCAYGVLVIAAVVAMIAHPRLLPHTANLFFTQYMIVLIVTLFVGQFPLILIHEAFHALAGRRLGLRSRLRVSRRLYFVVLETSLDGLVVMPRRRRYLPMLAGMLADVLVISVLTLVAALTLRPDGSLPPAGAVCLAMAFSTVLRLVWQFYFYLRTDLYHVVVTVLDCHDLYGAARFVLGNRFRRLTGRPARDTSALHPRDLAVARWYSWLMLIGYAASIGALLLVGLPTLWRSSSIALDRFAGESTWRGLLDSVLFLLVTYGQFAAALVLGIRTRLRRRTAATRSTS